MRYIGIDTPETVHPNRAVEPLGKEATAKNKELTGGKEVILIKDISETDKYGRLLRYVLADGVFINYELVKQGYAKVTTYPPDVACSETFLAAQRVAQTAKVGLWDTGNLFAEPSLTVHPQQGSSTDAPCNCQGADLDCSDFSSRASAQACFNFCYPHYGDIFRLDGDRDNMACERLK